MKKIAILLESLIYNYSTNKKIDLIVRYLNSVNIREKGYCIAFLTNQLKFKYNNDLLKKINTKNFSDYEFTKLINSKELKIEKAQLKSINDDSKFNINSIKLIYSMPLNSYTLISDNKNNIYLTKIIKSYEKDIQKMSKDFDKYADVGNIKIKNDIFSSYDYLLNKKYKIKINQKTLERVKNYFQ